MQEDQRKKVYAKKLVNDYVLFAIVKMKVGGDMNNIIDRITINPDICHGKPVVRNLRYPVEMILELLSSGMTIEQILNDYEDLEREDILACLNYATKLTQVKSINKIAI